MVIIKQREMFYRDYKNLYPTLFGKCLGNMCKVYDIFDYHLFENVFISKEAMNQ